MRAYPHYRDSGVEWLGAVPEHWQSGPLQRWFAIVNGGTPASSEETYWDGDTVWLTPDDLGQNEGAWIGAGRRTITAEGVRNSSARVALAGSIVLSTRAPIGHLAITEVAAATNQGCRTLVPSSDADGCFAYYALLASRSILQALGNGSTFMELTPTDLGGHVLPIPPLDEQRAIAAFLDRETERIDSLVARKRLLIERLREYRTALITRTVTRGLPPAAARAAGLDPSPGLKPSGVEWLGDVPEHWAIGRFSREVDIAEGQVNPEVEPFASMLLIAPNHIESGTGQLMETHTSAEQGAVSGKYLCRCGEVIYSKIRPALAKVTLAPTDCLCSADMYPMRTRRSLMNEYLYWLLLSKGFTIWSVLEADRVAMPKINRETLSTLRLPLPPISEQRALTDYLHLEIARLGRLQSRIGTAIERLDEMRAALVTAAVTGKIDVRESAMIVEGSAELPA